MQLNELVFYPGRLYTSGKVDAFVRNLNSGKIFCEVEFYIKTNFLGCLGKILSGTGTISSKNKTLNLHFDRKTLHIFSDCVEIATLVSPDEGDLFKSITTNINIKNLPDCRHSNIVLTKPNRFVGADGLRIVANGKTILMPLSAGSRLDDLIVDGLLETEYQKFSYHILAVALFYRMVVHQFRYSNS